MKMRGKRRRYRGTNKAPQGFKENKARAYLERTQKEFYEKVRKYLESI